MSSTPAYLPGRVSPKAPHFSLSVFYLVAILLPVAALAVPGDTNFVQLGGPGHMVRAASRWVPDLAVADRLLVGLKPGVRSAAVATNSVRALGGTVNRRLGRGRLLVVDLPAGSDILAAAAQYQNLPDVAFAEPDRAVYPTATPTDPEYPSQTHLPQIKAPAAWDIGTGSSTVVIAFVDSGIDLDHPDLADRIWTNPGEIPNNGIDDDGNGYIDDVHGWNFYGDNNNVEAIPNGRDENHDGEPDEQVNHGTLGASLAAAAANGWGCVGVAWQATIMPLKVFPDDGTTAVSTVVEAMYYAVDNGAFILNLSIGAGYEASFTGPIVELWNQGGITVSAAGNDNQQFTDSQSTWSSPACNNGNSPLTDNMNIGVGSVDSQDRKASWSNYDASTNRNFVDLVAPGVNLRGAGVYYPSVSGFTSYFTNNSGTSFSAPLVSGLAALLKAQDPTRTGADILRILRASCDNIDSANAGYAGKLGAGRINAARAMGAALPPGAPTNLAAADTSGDQGGSITLTWAKSADDGSGGNTVTSYIVSRAQGSATSAWTDLATLAKGSVEYVDNTTTDGLDYYYRVAASDGVHRVESSTVGPVRSFDDNAPTRVETLTVQDRPADTGGVLLLDWSGYVAPSDLAYFRIYRDTRSFSSVSGRTPLATLNNPSARTYTDSTTVDGADYYYAVTGVDTLGNERKDVITAGPVQSYANGPVSFPAGLQMLGAPALPLDAHPATLFTLSTSALKYARYQPTSDAYEIYSGEPLSDFLKLGLGRGFWIKLPTATTVTPSGTTAPAGNFDIAVQPGWQQLGNPFFVPVDFSASTVTYGTITMDLTSADAAGILRSYSWTYNASTGDYELVHPLFGATTLVAPWRGFWVFADKACTLTISRPSGTSAVSSTPRVSTSAVASKEWPVQIIARSTTAVDAANYFGVCSTANGIQSPPRPSGGLDLSFISVGTASASSAGYATSFFSNAASSMKWQARLAWDSPQGKVVLTWPDLSKVPADYNLYLTDLSTGVRTSMRHQTQYSFDTGQTPGERVFTLEASLRSSAGLQVTAMSVSQTGSGAQIVFTLSRDAQCEVSVMNIAGRPVRTVESSRLHTAGVNSVAWDGRNTTGTKVPSGQYLVRVSACADDGTTASALRLVRVAR
jgi:subtilisin family serine protease